MSKKVVVIGAGIIGLSSAYYLNKKGFEVTVIDDTDGTSNCSMGNAGYVCPSHVIPLSSPGVISQSLKWMFDAKSPLYVKPRINKELIRWGVKFGRSATKSHVDRAAPLLNLLCQGSQKLFENIMTTEDLDPCYRKSGLLMLCQSKDELKHEIEAAKLAKSLGQRAEEISVDEAKGLNPGLDLNISGAVYFKDDSCFAPELFMKQFQMVLAARDVKFCYNEKVESLVKLGDQVNCVVTDKGIHSMDELVVATGSFTPNLLKKMGIKLLMQSGKGYSFDLKNLPIQSKTPAILTDGRVAMSPASNGIKFAGTMEINGQNLSVNEKRIQGIKKTICSFFPQIKESHFDNIQPWAGLRPCSPDGLPYVGKSKQCSNMTIAAGHAMLGMTLGPITGQMVSEIVAKKEVPWDISLLDVDRFSN